MPEDAELSLWGRWVDGSLACKLGKPITVCPNKPGTIEARAWMRGWRAWEREMKAAARG